MITRARLCRLPRSGPCHGVRCLLACVTVVVALLGCSVDRILEVEDPDVVTPEALQDKAALPALLAGAQAEFQAAYGGAGGDAQITMSAMLTDELFNVETFPTRIEVDQRNIMITNVTMLGIYRSLHQARVAADRAAAAYGRLDPTAAGRAEAYALSGITYVLFGENYCSGVPFSRVNDAGQFEFGEPTPREGIFGIAVAKFDSALAVTAASAAVRNLARVGQARALLNRDSLVRAATVIGSGTADSVPTSFQYLSLHSENSGRQNNGVHVLSSTVGRRFSVPDAEGVNGIPWRTANDPRARFFRFPGSAGLGFDGFSPAFYQQKYPARASPVVVASGVEARLIEAEIALRGGDPVTWLAKLNALRANTSLYPCPTPPSTIGYTCPTPTVLPPLTDPGTQGAREDLHFRERGFWLFLTSHRLGDLRRRVRQYGRASNTVFPTGAYAKGGNYLNDVNFPIPFDEQNNPNFEECIDRAA